MCIHVEHASKSEAEVASNTNKDIKKGYIALLIRRYVLRWQGQNGIGYIFFTCTDSYSVAGLVGKRHGRKREMFLRFHTEHLALNAFSMNRKTSPQSSIDHAP